MTVSGESEKTLRNTAQALSDTQWRVGSRLGKLNLETKLGISRRRKEACIAKYKACIVKYNGVRADWWVMKSDTGSQLLLEARQVSSRCKGKSDNVVEMLTYSMENGS